MATTDFFTKCSNANFAQILQKMNYAFFTKGSYNLNIIGVRSNHSNKVTNMFDDALVVVYKTPNGKWQKQIYRITTEPGTYYMATTLMNDKGTSILVPNQYRGCWKIGKHLGKYDALVQVKKVSVYRDNNKDMVYDLKPETCDSGIFGINIHRSSEFTAQVFVNKYSAGCQVFADPKQYDSFMRLCKLQTKYVKGGSTFTYTLLEEKDLTIMLK